MKRKVSEQVDENSIKESCSKTERSSPDQCGTPCSSSSQDFEFLSSRTTECSSGFANEAACNTLVTLSNEHTKTIPGNRTKKKTKGSQLSQLSLRSFFQKSSIPSNSNRADNGTDVLTSQTDIPEFNLSNETPMPENKSGSLHQCELNSSASIRNRDQDERGACSSRKEKNSLALLEWQRVQQVMQNSIPLCKGHREPCVARVVKKQGPNFGRRFYVCARAEVIFHKLK